MRKKSKLIATISLCLSLVFASVIQAAAQVSGGVTSVGTVTAGHVATFKNKSQIQDGGTAIISGGAAGGDLSGTFPNPGVAKLQGNAVVGTNPLNTQCLVYTGTFPTGTWGPGSCAAGGAGTVTQGKLTAGTGMTVTNGGVGTCNSVTVFDCVVSITGVITAAGPIGDSSHVAQITYNAQGQLTTVASIAIALSALGVLPCSQLPAFTGDVTNVNCAMTIAAASVTGAKIASATITGANVAANTIANSNLVNMTGPAVKGIASGTGAPTDLTPTQLTTMCNAVTISLKGCVSPLSNIATDYYGGDGAFHTGFANPTATAGPVAVNGTATTAMRSDAAPAIQLGTNAVQGIVEGDTTTITCVAGVCSLTNAVAPTTWTPIDASGAALTFTAVSSSYNRIGNIVFAFSTFTYPTTASGAGARISGLPIAVANVGYGNAACSASSNNGAGAAVNATLTQATTNVTFTSNLNSGFSGVIIHLTCIYPVN